MTLPSTSPTLFSIPLDRSAHRPEPAGKESLGAVFTRRWVVDAILDLARYTPDVDLAAKIAAEPACGAGAFLIPMVQRLCDSAAIHGRNVEDAIDAIHATDLDSDAVEASRQAVVATLQERGVRVTAAQRLAEQWVCEADFLLRGPTALSADYVIGNPPYVRVEHVPPELLREYRKHWPTMCGRADVYVGFLEAGLRALTNGGTLAVICADRWMRNAYGSTLRQLVSDQFSFDVSLVMHDVDAFEDHVDAYPAVIVIRRASQGAALVAEADPSFSSEDATHLVMSVQNGPGPLASTPRYRASWSPGWFCGSASWPAGPPEELALVAHLEARFPALEETSAHVHVGVATGADRIFITRDRDLIEPDRLLPLVAARETTNGTIAWTGRYLVNPWDETGLVELDAHPQMGRYLRRHEATLRRRHVAQRPGARWWRTIDRVVPEVVRRPKLLIPDLKDRIHPVLDDGQFYPNHSLYYVLAEDWDLRILGGLLMSDVANAFVEAYSVRMASGYLRVSAQYLRRVRVPKPDELDSVVAADLAVAFDRRDRGAASRSAAIAYGLNG